MLLGRERLNSAWALGTYKFQKCQKKVARARVLERSCSGAGARNKLHVRWKYVAHLLETSCTGARKKLLRC